MSDGGVPVDPWPPVESRLATRAARRSPAFRTTAGCLLIWVTVGAVAAFVVFVADHSNQALYRVLDERGVRAQASVVGTEPENHNTVHYSFAVSGRTYSDGSRAHPPNRTADRLRIGDPLWIVYDPLDPYRSCACDPRALRRSARPLSVAVSGLFLGSAAAVPLMVWWRRRAASTAG